MGKPKIKEYTIDGETYIFAMLRPRTSLTLFKRVIKLLGPPIAKAFPETIKLKEIFSANINVGGALSMFADRFDDVELQEIIDVLFTQVTHKGEGALSQAMAYENLFTGRLKHLFKVVLKALEVQYADFLPDDKDPVESIINLAKESKD